jgi:hypothetical protein
MLIFLPLCMYCSPGGLYLSQSRRRQRVSLDSWENLDSVKKCVSTVEKSWSRLRLLDFISTSMSRPKVSIEIEKFIEIWKFWHFSTVCLDFDQEMRGFLYFLVEISQSVKTFHHFQTQKASTMLRFLNKSRQSRRVSTNLNNLDVSRQSRQKSRRVKVSTEKSQF